MDSKTDQFIARLAKFPSWLRQSIGISLIVGGLLGFLPVLGFWMIPLGLVVLSADYRIARHMHVNMRLAYRRLKRRWSRHRTGSR